MFIQGKESEPMRRRVVGGMVSMDMRRKIEPKGEITVRNVLTINYLAHDGVMQSPGAFR
jgi:hypothetical protein